MAPFVLIIFVVALAASAQTETKPAAKAGAYVLHCHFLGHEDRGMMLMVQAVCPGFPKDENYFSRTSLKYRECVDKELHLFSAPPPCPAAAGTKGVGDIREDEVTHSVSGGLSSTVDS